MYLTLRCHHQNDSCIKTGSDESHFNVALIVRDKVTRPYPQTTTFEEKRRAEEGSNRGPYAYQPGKECYSSFKADIHTTHSIVCLSLD